MPSPFTAVNDVVSILIWIAIVYFVYKVLIVSKVCLNKGNVLTCYWNEMVTKERKYTS
jgi:hypothetical protein